MPYKKILIFILTYNAERHIESVLDRIPESLFTNNNFHTDIIIIDDMSADNTVFVCNNYHHKKEKNITVLRNPVNQGYGGNQKVGYTYAIQNGYDSVVMLHGDGQYAPEYLEEMLKPLIENKADAVFGSRMLAKDLALKGGMPRYKFVANIFLTKLQNFLLHASLSEFHSGYRAYKTKTLESIPFQYNSNDFDFDTDIIIQLIDTGKTIAEVPIPTHYGDEICHVNGTKYAMQITWSTIISRVQKLGILYTPKFDYLFGKPNYQDKTEFASSHKFAIEQVRPGSTVLDFYNCNDAVAGTLKKNNCIVYGYDYQIAEKSAEKYFSLIKTDLNNFDFSALSSQEKTADYILLLDMLGKIDNPEIFLANLRKNFAGHSPKLIITTSNVAFIVVRLMLLIGQFNYGKRGILDMEHKRLFTFRSLRKLLENYGYKIEKITPIPVPINFIIKNNSFSKILLTINNQLIKISKGLFAFQIAIIATPMPTLDVLLSNAETEGARLEKNN